MINYYHRCIPKLAELTCLINGIINKAVRSKGNVFIWDYKTIKSFELIKVTLSARVSSNHFCNWAELSLVFEASNVAVCNNIVTICNSPQMELLSLYPCFQRSFPNAKLNIVHLIAKQLG